MPDETSVVEPSSLRMGFSRFDELRAPRMPAAYTLRTYQPGDDDAWIALLNTGDFGIWDRARLAAMLAGGRGPLPLDGAFFAVHDDRIVGAACTFLHAKEQGVVPEVGWVAVEPAHRGHNLAAELCRAVLAYVRELGHAYAFLHSEEWRPAAIKTYLRLGFEPEMTDATHEARWAALREELGV